MTAGWVSRLVTVSILFRANNHVKVWVGEVIWKTPLTQVSGDNNVLKYFYLDSHRLLSIQQLIFLESI